MSDRSWVNLFFRRSQCLRTTWIFRISMVLVVSVIPLCTRGVWAPALANSLTCQENSAPAQAILIDNLDQNYSLFERAVALSDAGYSSRVVIPTSSSPNPRTPTLEKEIADVMIRISHLHGAEIVAVQEQTEPISLNVAYQIRDYLRRENIRSVLLVSSGFRSKRTAMIYQAILGEAGLALSCEAVFDNTNPENWTRTWHGIQEVALQSLKLIYYRMYVLPVDRSQRHPDTIDSSIR